MKITRDFARILEQRVSKFEPLIQIILGPRQVGKSTAIKDIIGKYPGQAIYVLFDVPGANPEETIRFNWARAREIPGRKILVFDEIQNVPSWPAIVKELYDYDRPKGELSVVLLGSSALDLALRGEESLLGRYEIIRAPHWNLHEMQTAFNWNLTRYLQFGGYPILGEIFTEDTDSTLSRCQLFMRDSIVEPVISRDILALKQVMNTALFRQTLHTALAMPCVELSLTKLLGQLTDRGNVTTIKGYLELMEKAFLIKLLYRYSGGQMRMRTSIPKIVPLAPALVHAFATPQLVSTDSTWFGKLFEAALISRFVELGFDLFYWSNSRVDVDVVARKDGVLYAFEIKSNSTPDWRGLKAFGNEYPDSRRAVITRELGEALLSSPEPLSIIKSL
jgi:predicted AAA+ superfamily ATPase